MCPIILNDNGEENLRTLLQSMDPVLNDGEYVFCSVKEFPDINSSDILGCFYEKEGQTLILSREIAEKYKIPYLFISSWITLDIHSSLNAVGLTAAFSGALSKAGISCNVVAAYYHDHIFIPVEDSERAMAVLLKLKKDFQ